MPCEAGDRDTDIHWGAREDRQRPRERPALTADVQATGLGGSKHLLFELPRLWCCHRHPVQTHPSATRSLGDPPCPQLSPALPGLGLPGAGMAPVPCPMSPVSWVKRFGGVAWGEGSGCPDRCTAGRTLVTPLCVRGSRFPPGTTVYLMDKPRPRAHRLPGHTPMDTRPCAPGPALSGNPTWPDGPQGPLPPAAPAQTPPSRSSQPAVPGMALSHPLPAPSRYHVPQEVSAAGITCAEAGSPRFRGLGRPATSPAGTGPQTQQRPNPGKQHRAGPLELPGNVPHRWVGARECPKHTHVLHPRPPHPGPGRETLQRRLGLHQTLIRAPCGACSTATEGRPAQTFQMTQNLCLMG